MTIQKLHKVDRKESIFVFHGKISNWVRVALVEDTSWYCLQDVIDLLEVSGRRVTSPRIFQEKINACYRLGQDLHM